MKKRILIPTDFSKDAWHALTYGVELFRDEPCEFFLLNAFRPVSYALDSMMVSEPGEKYYQQCQEKSQEGLENVYQLIEERDDNPDHTFTTISEIGLLIDCMETVIENEDIELVIMGTKGATGSRAPVFGTNTAYAMENIRNCPVLAVPKEALFKDVKEIVFPTGYRTQFKQDELNHVINIAHAANSPVRFLHVASSDDLDEKQKDNKKRLTKYFETVEHTFHTLHASSITTALINFVESRDSDMIAFINKKHSFFENLFSTQMVKELGYFSKIPVLTLHDLRN